MKYILTRETESGEVDIEVEIEYAHYGPTFGARDSLCGIPGAGPPLEPDEPTVIEIESVKDKSGANIELTKKESEMIEEAILDYERDNIYDN